MSQNLTKPEQTDVKEVAASLMQQDAKASKSSTHTFMPNVIRTKGIISPAMWKGLSKLAKAQCILVNLQAEIICSCPHRGPSMKAKHDMQKMIEMKRKQKGQSSLGATLWNSSMSVSSPSEYSLTSRLGGGMISPENFSKLVFCFQHYALMSVLGRPQTAPGYPTIAVSEADDAARSGALDANTRSQIEYLWSSGFSKVSPSAQPLSPIGKLFGAAIMANAIWPSLARKIAAKYPPSQIPADEKYVDVLTEFPLVADMYSSTIGQDQNPLALLNIDPASVSNSKVQALIRTMKLANELAEAARRQVDPSTRRTQSQYGPDLMQQARQGLQEQQEAEAERRRSQEEARRRASGMSQRNRF